MNNPITLQPVADDNLAQSAPHFSLVSESSSAVSLEKPVHDMGSLLRWRAGFQGDRLAYLFLKNGEIEEQQHTYASLDRRARAVAARLQAAGVARGDTAVLLLPQGLDYVAAFFGCLYAGVIVVPTYPPVRKIHVERLAGIVRDCEAHILITNHAILTAFQAQVDAIPILKALGKIDMDELRDEAAADWQETVVSPDDVAFLQYTSGSTGTPKGVIVSHANIMSNEAMLAKAFDTHSASLNGSWLPFFHDMGLIQGLLHPLYLGAAGYLMTPMAFIQKPVRWLQMISRYRIRVSGAPNFAYDMCIRQVTEEQMALLDLSSWEVAYTGAETVRSETLRRFVERFSACGLPASAPYPCYGMAETTLIATGGHAHALPSLRTLSRQALERHVAIDVAEGTPGARTLVGVGRSLLEQSIRIVDPETLKTCPPNQVGEVWVAGPNIAQGYWRNPEATERDFRARTGDTGEGPFLRSGDLGLLDSGGELYLTSRLKDLIIIRGRNFIPADIEQVVEKIHPAFCANGTATFSINDSGEETLAAVVEITKEGEVGFDPENLGRAIRAGILSAFDLKITHIAFIRRSKLPRTTSGKIQRRACQSKFLAGDLALIGQWPAEVAPLRQANLSIAE